MRTSLTSVGEIVRVQPATACCAGEKDIRRRTPHPPRLTGCEMPGIVVGGYEFGPSSRCSGTISGEHAVVRRELMVDTHIALIPILDYQIGEIVIEPRGAGRVRISVDHLKGRRGRTG